MLDLLR